MVEFLKTLNMCLTIILDPKHQEVIDSLLKLGKTLNNFSKKCDEKDN